MPGLVISPYARRGYIDHQTLSFDAYDKFIEEDFLGNVTADFDFSQRPRPPLILPVHPLTTLTGTPGF